MGGDFKACCKNPTDMGSWRNDGVAKVWASEKYRSFRKAIAAGEYPDVFCETCCLNGTAQSLRQLIQKPLRDYETSLRNHLGVRIYSVARLREIFLRGRLRIGIRSIDRLRNILEKRSEDDETRLVLADYRKFLDQCDKLVELLRSPSDLGIYISKLRAIGDVIEDFIRGNVVPAVVAPLRQGNLIAICNARCIHCPGLFTEEITEGALMPDGSRFKEMSEGDIEKCFENEGHIFDFFMNGSEFLFNKNWQMVAARLKKQGVRVRVSTNGMLLNERNAIALIDNEYLGKLNLSLDGSTKETIEQIRQRVDFDRVYENLTFLLEYAEKKNYVFTFSMSFALMDINYRELPRFVELADKFYKRNPKIKPSIMVQPLAKKGAAEYLDFVTEHHPSRIDKKELDAAFIEMREKSISTGIPVFVFFTWSLADFIIKGCPIPLLDLIKTGALESQLED